MDDKKLQEVCSRIYFKHRQALDLIFENKPDMRDIIYSALVEKLEDEAKAGNVDFNKSGSSKTLIRFNTPYSRKLFPKLIEPRKSDWGTDFRFCYEIINRTHPLRLIAAMNNKDLSENEFAMCEKVCRIYENRPLRENWQWKTLNLSKRTRISEINPSDMSDEEFNESKSSIVDEMFSNIMKIVNSFEDMLKKNGL